MKKAPMGWMEIQCDLKEVEQFAGAQENISSAKELWNQKETAVRENVLMDIVPSHGARLFVL